MTSPINNNINRSTVEPLSSQSNSAKNGASAASAAPTQGKNASSSNIDTVSLSTQTIQVRDLQSQLNSIPEVDAEKVASIKKEIANGNYPVDSSRIAENLINLEKALNE